MRELAHLIGSGLLAMMLLGCSVAILSAGGPSTSATSRSSAPVPSPAPATKSAGERGWRLFLSKGCNGCHPIAGASSAFGIGPDLTDLMTIAGTRRPGLSGEAYVRESIVRPQAFIAPGFDGRGAEQMPLLPLSDGEVDALVAFLLTTRPTP